MSTPVLELQTCSIGYADTTVVHEVDLRFDAGESVALLGANGSGKTTLLKGALGLAEVHAGRLLWFGRSLHDVHDRARIGYVPQRQSVATTVPATVREVVAVGRLPLHRPWRRFGPAHRRTESAAIAEAVDAVGLADRIDVPVAHLSGGQQRRVLIARALAARPEVLVLDEPTAGVDAASQEALAATLTTATRAGVTVVVVTHELGALSGVVTRAVVLRAGRVAADGPPHLVATAAPAGAEHHDHGHHAPGTADWLPAPEVPT